MIDIKSPYTHSHSRGVTSVAVAICQRLQIPEDQVTLVRRAALLHDIGKLSVPNNILDKPGKLTAAEWETVRLHPYYTQRILERIRGFQHLAFVASSHHERLDGSGYFRNLRATQIPAARAPLRWRMFTMRSPPSGRIAAPWRKAKSSASWPRSAARAGCRLLCGAEILDLADGN